MVRQNRTKKRRAGRIGRTKIKHQGGFKRWDPNPKNFGDAHVKALWDKQKSPTQNLAAMGLLAHPNKSPSAVKHSKDANNTAASNNVIELFDIPDSDDLKKQKNDKHPPLKEDEQVYILKAMSKYGPDNYRRIFYDTKLNPLQHTQEKLQKMGARFMLLTTPQLRVAWEDIPAKIQSKMQAQPIAQEEGQEEDDEEEES